MSQALTRQRCFNHELREAAARCPECGRFYCRECVTDHEGRVLCVTCIETLAVQEAAPRRRWGGLFLALQLVTALLLLWLTFLVIGQGLALLPDSFHEETTGAP